MSTKLVRTGSLFYVGVFELPRAASGLPYDANADGRISAADVPELIRTGATESDLALALEELFGAGGYS